MPAIDNPNDGELEALKLRVRNLERAAPLGNSSITTGRLRIGGTAVLLVDSSGGLVIHGTINGDGTFTWTGTSNLNGPLNVAGAFALTGTETVSGGGQIIIAGANAMSLGVIGGVGLPGIAFASGGFIYGTSSGVSITNSAGNGFLYAFPASAGITRGSVNIDVSTSGIVFTGAPTTTSAANMFQDPTTGSVRRVTSARRFKIGPKLMKLEPSILDVRMKDWIDRTARKNKEPEIRVPGVIAEEVAAAGGESFITRDAKGEIEGVMYDRFATARTQALNDKVETLTTKLEAALKRIETLEKKLAS